MKKIYLVFSLLIVLFASCKKDGKNPSKPDPQQPDTTGKTYTINFNIGLDASVNSIGVRTGHKPAINAATALKDVATYLSYSVYDSNGQFIKNFDQTNTDADFGKITDTFDAGNYSVVIYATYGKPEFKTEGVMIGGRDMFCKKFNLSVSSSNPVVTQEVVLERIVGQLQTKILDPIPADAKYLAVTVIGEYMFSVKDAKGIDKRYSTKRTYTIPDSVKGKPNYTVATQVLRTEGAVNVQITCSNGAGKTLADVTVKNVYCYPNKRTILSGKLFDGPTSIFNVDFDAAWDPNIDDIIF